VHRCASIRRRGTVDCKVVSNGPCRVRCGRHHAGG
jgi:hypothetical protein